MRPQEIGIAERTEEIASRHVWLKSVLIDGNSFPTKIYRPRPTRRMSVTRRLEKLHRMRAAPRTTAIVDGKVVSWVIFLLGLWRSRNTHVRKTESSGQQLDSSKGRADNKTPTEGLRLMASLRLWAAPPPRL